LQDVILLQEVPKIAKETLECEIDSRELQALEGDAFGDYLERNILEAVLY
jgi:hypothetical protein